MIGAVTVNLKVSEFEFDHEAMRLIVFGLARECHDFALASDIPSRSVEDQLGLVLGVIDSHAGHLIHIRNVPTRDASCLASLSIGFSDEGYRLLAQAAKDRMTGVVD